MDFKEFLSFLKIHDYGVVAFNTYRLKNKYYFYIMVAQKGNKGQFLKDEGEIEGFNQTLEALVRRILRVETGFLP